MFDYFDFSLPRAVTEQLIERLDHLKFSPLSDDSLKKLSVFQKRRRITQGVYVIYLADKAVYAGKAEDLAERLAEHLWKLRGRKGIRINCVGYKALLLDDNWSTSANEGLLIEHYKAQHQCQWNGGGFGPKDPGKNRDGSEPSRFDDQFPVKENYPITDLQDVSTLGEVLTKIKDQVPYLFRYDIPPSAEVLPINLSGVPREVKALALQIAQTLGNGWQLMLFKNGVTLYHASRPYSHGTQLFPPQ